MSDDPGPALLASAAEAMRAYNAGFPLVRLAQSFVELGAREQALEIAVTAERERTEQPAEYWFALLAELHAMLGRRDDTERLAAKAEAATGKEGNSWSTLAQAFELVRDEARADAYLARLMPLDRNLTIVRMAPALMADGRTARAEKLAEEKIRNPDLRLTMARGYAALGDAAAAKRWLDLALQLVRRPDDSMPNLAVARVAGELGETDRAREIATAYDRATYDPESPYHSHSIELAHAYAAAGDRAKAGQILDGHAEFSCGTDFGYARVAQAYAELGFARGLAERRTGEDRPRRRYVPLEKILERAEAAFAKSGTKDAHSSLAVAYAWIGNIARASEHANAIPNLDSRANVLVTVARIVRTRSSS
jgi:tetratricopeptide (TPR) repeat protein